jgi:arylsulfatase A-like enzyme
MMGDHALYHDGWIASTKVMRVPWDVAGAVSQDPAGFPFELYDLTRDWTQFDNVAAEHPDKLKELKDMFWVEANKYQVLPARRLNGDPGRRAAPQPRRRAHRVHLVRRDYRYAERERAQHSRLVVQLRG